MLWRFEVDSEERANKLRLLKPKADSRTAEELLGQKNDAQDNTDSESLIDEKPGKGGSSKNPELR